MGAILFSLAVYLVLPLAGAVLVEEPRAVVVVVVIVRLVVAFVVLHGASR